MSLGSTSQWQAALLNYVPAIATELSASQIVIVFIGVILFCQVSHRIRPAFPGGGSVPNITLV